MKEVKIIDLPKGTDYLNEIEKLENEGWRVISGKPIEKIHVEIIGKEFVLEREI